VERRELTRDSRSVMPRLLRIIASSFSPGSYNRKKVINSIRTGFNADTDRAFYLNADPDPGTQTNADPDPGSQTNADP
jgi:hypothetical protein